MIFGGVFDRHPNLKVAVTENGSQWLPSLIRDMESSSTPTAARPSAPTSSSARGNTSIGTCSWAASLMKRYEAEMREEIGIERLMWGADYPHLEGAAPVHRLILRHVFGGMPEDDVRRMLGLNAVRVWGFDVAQLQAVADRVGPTVAELATAVSLDEIPKTFSWSLARPVPLSSTAATTA